MDNSQFIDILRSNGFINPSQNQSNSNRTSLSDAQNAAMDAMVSIVKNTPSGEAEMVAEELIPPKSLWDLSTEIIRGNYGNGKERQQRLEAEGYNYHQVQDFVNKRIQGTLADEDYNRNYYTQIATDTSESVNKNKAPDFKRQNGTVKQEDAMDAFMLALQALRNMNSPYIPPTPETGHKAR